VFSTTHYYELLQQLRTDLLQQLNGQLDDLFDHFIEEVEQIEQLSSDQAGNKAKR
jgi:hypothetical protein